MTAKLNDHESGHAWPWREVERLQQGIAGARAELAEAVLDLDRLEKNLTRKLTRDRANAVKRRVKSAIRVLGG